MGRLLEGAAPDFPLDRTPIEALVLGGGPLSIFRWFPNGLGPLFTNAFLAFCWSCLAAPRYSLTHG